MLPESQTAGPASSSGRLSGQLPSSTVPTRDRSAQNEAATISAEDALREECAALSEAVRRACDEHSSRSAGAAGVAAEGQRDKIRKGGRASVAEVGAVPAETARNGALVSGAVSDTEPAEAAGKKPVDIVQNGGSGHTAPEKVPTVAAKAPPGDAVVDVKSAETPADDAGGGVKSGSCSALASSSPQQSASERRKGKGGKQGDLSLNSPKHSSQMSLSTKSRKLRKNTGQGKTPSPPAGPSRRFSPRLSRHRSKGGDAASPKRNVTQKLALQPEQTTQAPDRVEAQETPESDVAQSQQLSSSDAVKHPQEPHRSAAELPEVWLKIQQQNALDSGLVAEEKPEGASRARRHVVHEKPPEVNGLLDLLELVGHYACVRDGILTRIPWPVLRRCRAVSKRFASVAARALEARPQVVAVGGGFNGVALPSVLAYDLATGSWARLPDMAHARNNVAVCGLDDGRIFAAGGFDAGNSLLGTVELFDPRNGEWTPGAPLSVSRSGCRACVTPHNRVLVSGGYDEDHGVLSHFEEYDPERDVWSELPPLKTPRYDHSACVIKPPGEGGKVLIAGGTDSRQTLLQSAEMYDLKERHWTSVQPMGVPRDQCSACILGDDTIVVLGGARSQLKAQSSSPRTTHSKQDPSHKLASCESFRLLANEWDDENQRIVPPMLHKRSNFGSATIFDSCIVAVGGDGSDAATARAEAYVPTKQQWTVLPPIPAGSERYGCGVASAVMRPGTTLWRSDEIRKLENGGVLPIWEDRALRSGATNSGQMAIGRKYFTKAGLSLVRVSGTQLVLQHDGTIIDMK